MNVACTITDDAAVGAVLNCSSLSVSPQEVALALNGETSNAGGVPHPFVIGASSSSSSYAIEIGPLLNSDIASSLSLNVLTLPQYVIGISACQPQSASSLVMNGTMLGYEQCTMSLSVNTRFNLTVTLIHIDTPPYFTITPLNITTSAVGNIGDSIWVPLSTVVVNPDPVYPYNITSFVVLQGPCSSASTSALPFAIGPSNGSMYYSVTNALRGWQSPVLLCVLAVSSGQLNASLDVTVWLASVPEQLIVSPPYVNVTHSHTLRAWDFYCKCFGPVFPRVPRECELGGAATIATMVDCHGQHDFILVAAHA